MSHWFGLKLLDADLLPDPVIRAGIRRICAARLRQLGAPDVATLAARRRQFASDRSDGPIAIDTAAANAQHYEVPTEFYRLVLGRHLKYSSAFWDEGTADLDAAEARMLALSCERAQLADGQRVLELGCGWGALSLWIARHHRRSTVVGVSNSRTQKAWIDAQAVRDRLTNLTIITADMNVFDAPGRFDRVVSIEMFEHMRNWRALLTNVARWLAADGRAFIHIFTHHRHAYAYDVRDASDWMAQYFFSGGIMPSDDLLDEFADVLAIEERWRVSGAHYQKTADAWLANMDRHRRDVFQLFIRTYGDADARRWWVRWRVFFMACSELWGWNGGQEWGVSHYRLRR